MEFLLLCCPMLIPDYPPRLLDRVAEQSDGVPISLLSDTDSKFAFAAARSACWAV